MVLFVVFFVSKRIKTLWAKTTLKVSFPRNNTHLCAGEKPAIKKPFGSTVKTGALLLSSTPP